MTNPYEDEQDIRSARQKGRFKGMQHFEAWLYGPFNRGISPTDIDGHVHNWSRNIDEQVFWWEFKPNLDVFFTASNGRDAQGNDRLTCLGQMNSLTYLQSRTGWLTLLLEDPFAGRTLKEHSVGLDVPVTAYVVPPIKAWTVKNDCGRVRTSIGELNELLHLFMDDENPPVPEKFSWRKHWPHERPLG